VTAATIAATHPADRSGGHRGEPTIPALIKHRAFALSWHVGRLRQADVPVPTEVDELAALLTRSVRSRPEATAVADDRQR
jgi:hypothetical protein